MGRRKITSQERAEALARGMQEGKLIFPGRSVSVQVNELTDEHGNVTYKVLPVGGDFPPDK